AVAAAPGAAVQGRLHRRARDEEGLEQEGLDQDRQDERHDHEPRQLPHEPEDGVLVGGTRCLRVGRSFERLALGFGLHGYRVSAGPRSTLSPISTALNEAHTSMPGPIPMPSAGPVGTPPPAPGPPPAPTPPP